MPQVPAAFGRLCVETMADNQTKLHQTQPPSGGCVLKQQGAMPSDLRQLQPPSGGCVLKRIVLAVLLIGVNPAAFGRLCVETVLVVSFVHIRCPAAFGRLCVETLIV